MAPIFAIIRYALLETFFCIPILPKTMIKSEDDYKAVADIFSQISGYRDADSIAKQCLQKAEDARKDGIYRFALANMKRDTIGSYDVARRQFESIAGWKDVSGKIN